MKKCIACGKAALMPETLGTATFCKTCSLKIKMPLWINKLYSDKDQLIQQREKILASATKNNFTAEALNSLNSHFMSEIDAGFVTAVNGKENQTIKIYQEYCIVNTTPQFDIDSMAVEYSKILESTKPTETFLDKNSQTLIHGLLKGKVLQTGVSLATAAMADSIKKEYFPNKASFPVCLGEKKVLYSECRNIDLIYMNSLDTGLLKFNSSFSPSDDVLFFFSSSIYKKILSIHTTLKGLFYNNQKNNTITKATNHFNYCSQDDAEAIRKYKELLDDGILTQEEFDAKKKQLLGL